MYRNVYYDKTVAGSRDWYDLQHLAERSRSMTTNVYTCRCIIITVAIAHDHGARCLAPLRTRKCPCSVRTTVCLTALPVGMQSETVKLTVKLCCYGSPEILRLFCRGGRGAVVHTWDDSWWRYCSAVVLCTPEANGRSLTLNFFPPLELENPSTTRNGGASSRRRCKSWHAAVFPPHFLRPNNDIQVGQSAIDNWCRAVSRHMSGAEIGVIVQLHGQIYRYRASGSRPCDHVRYGCLPVINGNNNSRTHTHT